MATIVCGWSLDLNMGGTESYMFRMADWAKNNNHRFIMALQERRKIDSVWEDDIKKSNIRIERFKVKSPFSVMQISEEFRELLIEEKTFVIAMDITSYFQFVFFKALCKATNLVVIYYILHPYVCMVSLRKIVNFPYNAFLKKQFGRSIIFMDEESISYCENHYHIEIDNHEVFRIGFDIEPLNESTVEKRTQSRKKPIILSCSRMDFPFKGYQKGIIDSFERFIEICPNMHFIIIGTGKDAHIIDKEIEKKKTVTHNRVTRISKIPYSQLDDYMRKSHIYIGMGTTLLDAAKHGLPSIVATMNQIGIKSSGQFCECYNNVTGNVDLSGVTTDFVEQIEKIYNMDDETYRELQYRSYSVYKENYDINNVMNRLLSFKSVDMPVSKFLLPYEFFLAKHQNRII